MSMTPPAMPSEPPVLQSLAELLLKLPLYDVRPLPDDENFFKQLYGVPPNRGLRMDGHCPGCRRSTTFAVSPMNTAATWNFDRQKADSHYGVIDLTCARTGGHKVRHWLLKEEMNIQKVGQYPSFADIANDAIAPYRKLLNEKDAAEFHKAVGLAAHGVGVGSFVYLRRVFERLVYGRFDEFKEAEGWEQADFNQKKMDQKIDLLKDHLPPFMVERKRIYSILSLGLYELTEKQCLAYFDVLFQSIILILKEDEAKKEELARRAMLEKAIADFDAPPPQSA